MVAALPGFKAEDVQINVTGEVLTIRGEMKREEEQKEKAWHTPALRAGASVREQRWGSFERSIALPTDVVSEKAQADFDNGILTITGAAGDPTISSVKPKTITVKAK